MASLHPHPRSPFWQLQFIDKTGKRRVRSTGLRCDSREETQQAELLRAEAEVGELEQRGHSAKGRRSGWSFVPPYIAGLPAETSRQRYRAAWLPVSIYLKEKERLGPADVRFSDAQAYIGWRLANTAKLRPVKRNTAILEIKVLAQVLHFAVRETLISATPLVRLGMKKDPPNRKRMFTPDEITAVRKVLAEDKDHPKRGWMWTAFEIALYTGCRLSETRVPLSCIDLRAGTITFPDPKGGTERAFTTYFPDDLRPVLVKCIAAGGTHTLTFPSSPTKTMWSLFNKLGIGGVSFHSTRITRVTELALADVPPVVARGMVGHADALVHQTYQRVRPELHLHQWRNKGVPPPPPGDDATPRSPSAPPGAAK